MLGVPTKDPALAGPFHFASVAENPGAVWVGHSCPTLLLLMLN
jgi:hypothetical protein